MSRNRNDVPRPTIKKDRKAGDKVVVRLAGKPWYCGDPDDPASQIRAYRIIERYLTWGKPRALSQEQAAELNQIRKSLPGGNPQAPDSRAAAPAYETAPIGQDVTPAREPDYQRVRSAHSRHNPPQGGYRSDEPAAGDMIRLVDFGEMYLEEIKDDYVHPNGEPTGTYRNKLMMIRRFTNFLSGYWVHEVSARDIKSYRSQWIADAGRRGITADYVNQTVHTIQVMFRWGVENDLVHPHVSHAVSSVKRLRAGQQGTKAAGERPPVPDEVIEATLPWLPPVTADMVRLQRLTGARPMELFRMRPCDVEFNEEAGTWDYYPEVHKTGHHGLTRMIPLNQDAWEILEKYMDRPETAYCFSPKEECQQRLEIWRECVTSGDVDNMTKEDKARLRYHKNNTFDEAGDQFVKSNYYKKVEMAIQKANRWRKKDQQIPRWTPYQIRHTFAEAVEEQEDDNRWRTRAALGHTTEQMTKVYTKRDQKIARAVASRVKNPFKKNGRSGRKGGGRRRRKKRSA